MFFQINKLEEEKIKLQKELEAANDTIKENHEQGIYIPIKQYLAAFRNHKSSIINPLSV